jgi:hypothetical protein
MNIFFQTGARSVGTLGCFAQMSEQFAPYRPQRECQIGAFNAKRSGAFIKIRLG